MVKKYLFSIIILISLFLDVSFNKVLASDTTYTQVSISEISSSLISQDRADFPYGTNVLFGTNQIPFSIPTDGIKNNYYNSSYGNEHVTINTSINSPQSAYILFVGAGTHTESVRNPALKFGEINLYFSDGTSITTDLIERWNLREWISNDPTYNHITSDPTVEQVWSGWTPQGNGPTVVDMLHIQTPNYQNKELTKIEFIDTFSGNTGFHILGITVQNEQSEAPLPVVLIPGFLGSWSYKGIVENQPTTYSDWILMPNFGEYYYNPLINTLKNAGLIEDKNLFTFAYDWRKSVADNAVILNNFLASKNSGQKFNIVAHSMGGLIIRYCYEKVSGCSDKINKIITNGTPHLGTIQAYPLWEGGQFDESNPMMKILYEIAIRSQAPYYLTTKDVIQNKMPGVRDLLPIFNYLSSKSYSQISSIAKNNILESLTPASSNFTNYLTSISGYSKNTAYYLNVDNPSFAENLLGLWPDGRPNTYSYTTNGDSTILKNSAELANSNTLTYEVEHKDYFRNSTILSAILEKLNLTGTPQTGPIPPSNLLSFVIHSPATITVTDQNNNPIGTNIDGKAVFIPNSQNQNYNITLTGTGNGNFTLDSFYTDGTKPVVQSSYQNQISLGQSITFIYNPLTQTFSNANNDIYWQTFKFVANQLTDSSTKLIINPYQISPNSKLESLYYSLIDILKKKQNPERQNMIYLIDSLQKHIDARGGLTGITKSLCDSSISRANTSILNERKVTLNQLQALNIILAKEYLAKSQNYLSKNQLTLSYLSAKTATILASL